MRLKISILKIVAIGPNARGPKNFGKNADSKKNCERQVW